MIPNQYPLFTITEHDQPEQIEMKIGMLMRLYLKEQNQSIATSVEQHINALLAHLGYISDAKQRCLFLRMAAQWRCLAWLDNDVKIVSGSGENQVQTLKPKLKQEQRL